jgi:hypothetical protein
MTHYTINTLPASYANKIVCCFCSQYANENFCVSCNEYKGLMTLAEFMTTYEISEWVSDEADELSAKLDSLIAKGVYA